MLLFFILVSTISASFRMFKRGPNVAEHTPLKQESYPWHHTGPILSASPTGQKQTSKISWTAKETLRAKLSASIRTGSEILADWAGGWKTRTCCQGHTAGSLPRMAAQQETAWQEKDATDVPARGSQSSRASKSPSLQAGKFCPQLPLSFVSCLFWSRTSRSNGFLSTDTHT